MRRQAEIRAWAHGGSQGSQAPTQPGPLTGSGWWRSCVHAAPGNAARSAWPPWLLAGPLPSPPSPAVLCRH